ncbi:MAG: hypothetical protein IJC13_03620 [Clostridia bacterium]|nr:hypothetical protein [Clostridia bacterium]
MSFLAALMGAIPVALIAAVCIPLLVIEMGIEVLPSLFNPEFYTELIEGIANIPELQPDVFLDYVKTLLENGVGL